MKAVKLTWWIRVVVLLVVGLFMGAQYDLQVSTALYHENSVFSQLMAVLGSLPAYVLLGFVGPLFFIHYKGTQSKFAKFFAWSCLFGMPFVAGLGFGLDALHDVTSNKLVALANGVIIMELLDFCLYFFLFDKGTKRDTLRDAHIIGFTIGFTVLVGLFFKEVIARPRFLYVAREFAERRFLHVEDFYRFFDTSCRLTAEDVGRQYYLDSFPSGHAALAGATMILPIIAKYNDKTKGKEDYFFIGAAVWMFISMFSRIWDGHHYLSDVCFGALIGVILAIAFALTINFGKKYEITEEKLNNGKDS